MKKLFLLLAAFTCMPTYTRDPQASDIIIVLGVLIGSTYMYGHYYKTPTNNGPQQINKSDSNRIPKDNTPLNNSTPPTIIPTPNDGDYALHLDVSHKEHNGEELNKFSVEITLPNNFEEKIKENAAGYFDKKILNMMLHINK